MDIKETAIDVLQSILSSYEDNEKSIDLQYIEKYKLYIPENMFNFIINIYFDSFKSVIEGIEDIRMDMLSEVISYIDTAKKNLFYAYKNPAYKDTKLSESHSDLTNVTSKLENKIKQYAFELQRIDNRNGLSGLIFSPFDLTKVKNITKMSKIAFKSYLEALFLLTIIDNSRGANSSVFIEQGKKFVWELENNKYTNLFFEYDKHKSEIWKINNMENLIDNASLISASFDDYIKRIQP